MTFMRRDAAPRGTKVSAQSLHPEVTGMKRWRFTRSRTLRGAHFLDERRAPLNLVDDVFEIVTRHFVGTTAAVQGFELGVSRRRYPHSRPQNRDNTFRLSVPVNARGVTSRAQAQCGGTCRERTGRDRRSASALKACTTVVGDDFEIVKVDHGSRDHVWPMLNDLATRDSRR